MPRVAPAHPALVRILLRARGCSLTPCPTPAIRASAAAAPRLPAPAWVEHRARGKSPAPKSQARTKSPGRPKSPAPYKFGIWDGPRRPKSPESPAPAPKSQARTKSPGRPISPAPSKPPTRSSSRVAGASGASGKGEGSKSKANLSQVRNCPGSLRHWHGMRPVPLAPARHVCKPSPGQARRTRSESAAN
jgi:hypothetical protein